MGELQQVCRRYILIKHQSRTAARAVRMAYTGIMYYSMMGYVRTFCVSSSSLAAGVAMTANNKTLCILFSDIFPNKLYQLVSYQAYSGLHSQIDLLFLIFLRDQRNHVTQASVCAFKQ